MVGREQELNLVACSHKAVRDEPKSMECHQNLAFRHRSHQAWEQSSCCHGVLWTTVFLRQLLLPLYVQVLSSFAKGLNLGDKCTSLTSSILPLRVLVSLWLFRSWDKSFRQSPGSEQSANLFMWLGKLWVHTALLSLKTMTWTEMSSVLGKKGSKCLTYFQNAHGKEKKNN